MDSGPQLPHRVDLAHIDHFDWLHVSSALHPLAQAGPSPLQLGPKAEESGKVSGNPLSFLLRLLLGSAAGFYYFLVSCTAL